MLNSINYLHYLDQRLIFHIAFPMELYDHPRYTKINMFTKPLSPKKSIKCKTIYFYLNFSLCIQ